MWITGRSRLRRHPFGVGAQPRGICHAGQIANDPKLTSLGIGMAGDWRFRPPILSAATHGHRHDGEHAAASAAWAPAKMLWRAGRRAGDAVTSSCNRVPARSRMSGFVSGRSGCRRPPKVNGPAGSHSW
jgi:hypothetical protein